MLDQNSYSKEDLVKAGTGEMFGEGNSQLPSDNMLMMDRIISITEDGGGYGKGEIIAELSSLVGQVVQVAVERWV
jgi:3-hydroxyacyl-[acyl-carrier protein] dehydratase/trans-2-decenoyl-[acyl-carrier protein] isomerase